MTKVLELNSEFTLADVLSIIAIIISIIALIYSKKARKDSYFFKEIEQYKSIELTPENLMAILKAHGVSKKKIKSIPDFDVLIYYVNLVYTVWLGIDNVRVKRLKRRFPFWLYSRYSFDQKVAIARKMDKKKPFFPKQTQRGQIFSTPGFANAWNEYIHFLWARNNKARTAVLIEAHLKNIGFKTVMD